MASEYCRQILRVVVAQLCQHLGWHSTHATPLEVLTDVLERYLLDVSRTTHQYAERYGRTEVTLDDLGLAFRTLGVSLTELDDYVKHVEALPFAKELAAFPKPKKSNLCFPNPKSREIYHREEHVPPHLPYMFPGMEDEMEVEEEISPAPSVPAASQPGSTTPVTVPSNQEIGTPENLADTSPALRGEKRPLNSPTDGAHPYKRQRLSNNNLPEEAGHSQYEMTHVKMSVTGLLTPIKSQGKLPDPSPPVMFPPVERKKEPPPKEIPKKAEPEEDSNTSKIEDKENITTKKAKENDTSKKNLSAKGLSKIVSKTSTSSTSGKPLKKNSVTKGKITKIVKKGNLKSGVSVKGVKSKVITKGASKIPGVKTQAIKGSGKTTVLKDARTSAAVDGSASESRLKELLLEKGKDIKVEKKIEGSNHLSKKAAQAELKPWNNSVMASNPAMLSKHPRLVPGNNNDDSSSSDESPEPRLIIAESDPKPKERKSAEMIREQNSKYDRIISSAIKRAGMMNSKNKELMATMPHSQPGPTHTLPSSTPTKERKKAVTRKKKEPTEKLEKSTLETIDECINSVLRNVRAAFELEKMKERQEAIVRETISEGMMAAAVNTGAGILSPGVVAGTVAMGQNAFPHSRPVCLTPKKADRKGEKKLDKKKRNLMKEKTKKLKIKALKQKGKENAEVREKLKEKIKSRTPCENSSSSEKTPPVRPDKFSAEEWKIYDFDGSPPVSHSNSPPPSHQHHHKASSSPAVPVPLPPFSSSPQSIRSCVSPSMDSLTLLSTAASAASNVPTHLPSSGSLSLPLTSASSQDSDISSQLRMKIGLAKEGKNKVKSKVKSKDKVHKKEKKEKKKEKEKKKKNKDKEEKKQKERIKEEKYQFVVVPQAEQISTPLSVPRLKLNIKFGGSTPVAVTPDANTNKKSTSSSSSAAAVSLSIADRASLNTPVNIKRDVPSSPTPHRLEIPRLVIRTPVPVMSPPVVPGKIEKTPTKVTKATPKAKATPRKKAAVKKPVVKKEKAISKKMSNIINPELVNVPSICKIEALNAPPQIPQFMPNVSPLKHSEIGKDNLADKLMPESVLAAVPPNKFPSPKTPLKSQKAALAAAAAREKLTAKEKQMLLKAQTVPIPSDFGLRKVEEKPALKGTKVGPGRGKGSKMTTKAAAAAAAAASAAAAKLPAKIEKVSAKAKSEKATAKAKAEKNKAEKAALEIAAIALAKVEQPIIMKNKPVMKVNRPPNKLGRPPKVRVPPSSPPPTIPYPSSPPCIPASIGGALPVAQPIGQHFAPLLANIPTPVPTVPRPVTVSTPAPKSLPKVAATARTVSTPRGRGARAHTMSKAQKLASPKNLLASAKDVHPDSHVTCPSNLLTPMPLTSSSSAAAAALPEKLAAPNKTSPIPSPLSSPLHMISGLPPDNSLIALSRDIVSANVPMDTSASFGLPIGDIVGSSENATTLGKRQVQRSVFAETVGTFMDENGQKIWICPGCKLPDDGSPMIGCDGCDDWYHWPCVNIREEPPAEEQWFCQKCLIKTKNKPKRKRRRKTKTY